MLKVRSGDAKVAKKRRFWKDEILQRLSDLIGPYRGTYRIVYRVLQPLLDQFVFWNGLEVPLEGMFGAAK